MKGIAMLLAALLASSGSSFAEPHNHEIDSLELVYETAKSDSAKFDALKMLCFKIYGIDSAKTELYVSLLMTEVEKCKDPVEKGDAYAAIGDYYNSKLDFANALRYFHLSIGILKNVRSDRGKIAYAKCLLDYAYIFHVNGDFNTALSSYLEAEDILDKYPEYDSRSAMYDRLSDVYSRINNPRKSAYYDRKAAGIADSIKSPKLKALYYVDASYTLDNEKDFDRVVELLTRARSIGRRESLHEIVWIACQRLGEVYASLHHYNKAVYHYTTALTNARALTNRYDESITLESLSQALISQGRYKEAQSHLHLALGLAEQIKANSVKKDIYQSLSALSALEGNYRRAYKYLKNKEAALYQTFDENDQRQVNFLNAKYDAADRQAEIKRLTDERKIQRLEIDRRTTMAYYLLATLGLVLVAGFFSHRYYHAKRKVAEQENQLQARRIADLEREKRLAAVQYALQGEENERSRLARDLHDGLGGLLSGAKMAFSSFREKYIKDGQKEEYFRHAFDLLSKSIVELQSIAHNMMPQALVNGSLKEALSEFCEKVDNGNLSLQFRFFGTEERLAQQLQVAIYRIVQELVNNIIKHSRATEALVQLIQEKDRLSITVQDNGKGFDPAKSDSSEGHGLKNIRMRVEALGGHFDIDSRIEKGTEVSFEFENPAGLG